MRFEGQIVPNAEDPEWVAMPCCGSEFSIYELKSAPVGLLPYYCPGCEHEFYEEK